MRVSRLDLMAFGPFTGQTLDFGTAGTPLHIVYGPNEAGKSSCLRALRAWLYSIPSQNSDNFLHQYASMRIGGVIEGLDGKRLEFIRRKGNSKTIRANDDLKVIEDTELNQFLGGVDQPTFEQRFAIDYQELRKGGEQIAKGTGQLSEILFAAGAGITHLREIQRGMDEQIQNLFKPRGTNAKINNALNGWKETRSQVKQLSLATTDWEKHREALQQAQERLSQLTVQLDELRVHHSRCDRLLKALPLSRKLDFAQGLLKDVADAPVLPTDFSERRSQVVDRLRDADDRMRESQQEITRLQRLVADVALPDRLLQHRSEIAGLHTELGGYQKAAKDRPRLTSELRSLQSQAEKHLARIGWGPDLDSAGAFQLKLSQRSRIDALASEWTALVTLQDELLKTEAKLRKSIAKLETEATSQRALLASEELKRIHRRASRHANSERELQQMRKKSLEIEQKISLGLSRLPLYQGTIEQLAGLAVPFRESIERFSKTWRAYDERISKYGDRIEDLNQRIRQLDRKIEKLRLEYDLPTEDDLQQARNRREAGWQLLRRVLSGDISEPSEEAAVVEYISSWPGKDDLPQAFHASIDTADNIADRLRQESLRVSEKSNWTSERYELLEQLESERTLLVQATNEKLVVQHEWQDSWRSLGIDPLTPDEMLAWVQARDDLIAMHRESSQVHEEAKILECIIADLFRDIHGGLSSLSYPGLTTGTSLIDAIDHCESVIRELDDANQQVLLRSQKLEKLREDLAEVLDARQQSEERLKHWKLEWSLAADWLGQSEAIRPDEAQSILREIDQLVSTLNEMEDLKRRISGIDRDAKEFSAKVGPVVKEAAPDLILPMDQAVIELHERLQEALATQSRVHEWQQQLLSQQSKQEKAAADMAHWRSEIQSLCTLANCAHADDLPPIEQRARARLQYEKEVRDYGESLVELAGSEAFPKFLDCVRATDSDQLGAEFQRLSEQIAEQELAKAEAAKEVGARQADLHRMDGSALAAQAQEEMEHHMATIRSGAEQYIRLRLADKLLQRSIERFREANQGPILSRASQLFAELTLGSFAGLQADFDEQGRALLVGVRKDHVTPVRITGMSTGTCDQLYLALRLAMIESHVRDHHPIPFIVDDILIQFDDDRTAVALKLLGELAEKTQVIYFTHHRRIVELASQHLPQNGWVEHTIG